MKRKIIDHATRISNKFKPKDFFVVIRVPSRTDDARMSCMHYMTLVLNRFAKIHGFHYKVIEDGIKDGLRYRVILSDKTVKK